MKKLYIAVILVVTFNISFAGFNNENKKDDTGAIADMKSTAAKTDAIADDTATLQALIDECPTNGTVSIPAGTYYINQDVAIKPKPDMTLNLTGVTFQANISTSTNLTAVIRVEKPGGCNNVTINGGTIIGDRKLTTLGGNESAMGIAVFGSSNVTINGTTAKDCKCDGFFVGYNSRNVRLSGVTADNNRRQGLSVVHADGVIIENSVFKNTNGTAPAAGMDIEPNGVSTPANNVQIRNSQFLNNHSNGIIISDRNHVVTNVIVDGNTIIGNGGNGAVRIIGGVANSYSFTNNTISDATTGFVLELSSTGNTITGNTVTAPALIVGDIGGNTISDNILNGNTLTTSDFSAQYNLNSGTGANPNGIATGDFDGDGKLDLVTSNAGTTNVSVFRNTGFLSSGEFYSESFVRTDKTIGATGTAARIAVGDLDGDGKPDLAVTNSLAGANVVMVFRNTNNGTPGNISFADQESFATGTTPWGVAIGDFDRDGKPDLAVSNSGGSDNVSVLRNKSAGIGNIDFYTKVDFTVGSVPRSIAIGDIDGDGKPDVVTANNSSANISVLRNISSGSGNINFAGQVTYTAISSPWGVAIGDIDLDGKPEVVTPGSTAYVSVFKNQSTSGTISLATKVDFVVQSTSRSVAIADIDGDSKPDLVSACYSSTGPFSVLINSGLLSGGLFYAGSFEPRVSFNTGSHLVGMMVAADIDGDGKPDLAGPHTAGTDILIPVLRNKVVSGNTWIGITSTDWNTALNWSGSTVPTITSNFVTIPSGTTYSPVVNQSSGTPAVCSTLTIASGATLTIAPAKALTVTGALTNNATSAGLVIQSNANGTGSLIAGSVSGSATAQRWMTTGAWHLVSSPVPGQTVATFLTANTNIPTYSGSRGMMDYNPASNTWNSFFTTGTGSLTAGRGFSMRVGASNAAVTFIGTLQAGLAPVTGLSPDSWNCIGNPYTSAMGINTAGSSTAKFLQINAVDAANIDPAYGAVYVWDKTDASNGQAGNYTAVSNASGAFEVQQGQAFFVKMNTSATSVSFTSAMQIHNGALALKSAEIPWPTIKLAARVGAQSSETVIAFNSAMTNGLDPSYDAGLFRGGSDLIVYSRLVEDNGIPFAIQALPDNSYNSLVIPIGIDFRTGGEVVFSAQLLNLPTECKVILEDKVSKIFTDLLQNTYTVSLQSNSVVADRFQIHTSALTTGINPNQISAGILSAYAIRNTQINVTGEVGKNALATLYDIQGRVILVKAMEAGNSNVIRTPNLRTGIYLLIVKDNQKQQRIKLPINE